MRRLASSTFAAIALLAGSLPAPAVTISGTYYEDHVEKTCSAATTCFVAFELPAATAGSLLNVHYLSCWGQAGGLLYRGLTGIADSAQGSNGRRIQALAMEGKALNGNFTFREALEMKVTGGPPRHVLVTIYSAMSGTIAMTCSITGELTSQ